MLLAALEIGEAVEAHVIFVGLAVQSGCQLSCYDHQFYQISYSFLQRLLRVFLVRNRYMTFKEVVERVDLVVSAETHEGLELRGV